jgi:hypothetical protein
MNGNAIQTIRQGIHYFLIFAVIISAIQEFDFTSKPSST